MNTARALRSEAAPRNQTPVAVKRSVVSIDAGDHRERVRAKRDELVAQYTPLVLSIAESINRRTPPSIELEDLIQTGMLALMHAATTYRPEAFPGITFGAYARHRVRGAILDSISGRHWQNATLDEMPVAESVLLRALDTGGERISRVAPPAGLSIAPSTDAEIDAQREMARVKDAIEYLDEDERQILAGYYTENGNFSSAGEELGLSRRRAGELHAEAIAKVRRILHVA